MDAQELYAAMDDRRRERGLMRWQVAIEVGTSVSTLGRLKHGVGGPVLRAAVQRWLDRPASV